MPDERHCFCLVGFGDGKRRWYRAGSPGIRPGTRVIAPVSGNGQREIGVVLSVRYVLARNAPSPPNWTPGRAGRFGEIPRPSRIARRAARNELKKQKREREDRELDDRIFFMELIDDLDYND